VQNSLSKYIFFKWFILPWSAFTVFCLTEFFVRNPLLTETIYSQKIYPKIARVISAISNIFPFSLDDLFYVLLVVTIVILLLLTLFKKISLKKAGKIVVNVLATIYILFYVLWGFNYFRENLNNRLELAAQIPDTNVFIQQLETLIENTNNSFCSFEMFDKKEIDSLIEESYKHLSATLKIDYPSGKRKDKKITFSRFFAQAGISGYYGPFFNEVHVNTNVLPLEYPFVLAHEKAHQFGITSEAEANFYAWLVCIQSSSKQIKYSANLHILRFFLYQGYQLEKYPEIISKLDENVKNDFQRINENWERLRNEKVDKVASKINDTYLKTNKIENGIEDYNGVVKFVMDFSLDSAFQEEHYLNLN
jgi:DNA-binding transcriptional MerR regulator/low affinity Fe/Cu permease